MVRSSHAGRQHCLNLEAGDKAAALARAVEIHASPELADINLLELEIKDYVRHQLDTGKLTRNSAANRTVILNRWADHIGTTEVRNITAENFQSWYHWLKLAQDRAGPLTEGTAQSYFNHLVRENTVRINPVIGVETARLEPVICRQCAALPEEAYMNESTFICFSACERSTSANSLVTTQMTKL